MVLKELNSLKGRTEALVGVISDTHGLLRPEAVDALRGADVILHAGDVGSSRVLDELRAVAPLVAVRGNVDEGAWAEALSEREVVDVGGVRICSMTCMTWSLETSPTSRSSCSVIHTSLRSKSGTGYSTSTPAALARGDSVCPSRSRF